ncbi:hypothetical protein [Cytophaga aurantiaca]|uniref:hypothetical protein n=1 Tax=Cytophaga aurantiaca TaxID=29530 RepID=UPI00037BEE34|nr:hypothetical protein [Cytophaga aurantiaca]
MKKILYPIALSAFILVSCDKKPDVVTDGIDSSAVVVEDTAIPDKVKHIDSIPPNSEVVDSLLKKPVTTPANNPFGLKAGDKLSSALSKDPLKKRLQTILGDKYEEYVKFLATAKPLKKDSDGFLYTQGASAKGSKNEAFFLYHHENDVLFLGYQKGEERIMLNDMKSRMFAPQSVDTWVERPIE